MLIFGFVCLQLLCDYACLFTVDCLECLFFLLLVLCLRRIFVVWLLI